MLVLALALTGVASSFSFLLKCLESYYPGGHSHNRRVASLVTHSGQS